MSEYVAILVPQSRTGLPEVGAVKLGCAVDNPACTGGCLGLRAVTGHVCEGCDSGWEIEVFT